MVCRRARGGGVLSVGLVAVFAALALVGCGSTESGGQLSASASQDSDGSGSTVDSDAGSGPAEPSDSDASDSGEGDGVTFVDDGSDSGEGDSTDDDADTDDADADDGDKTGDGYAPSLPAPTPPTIDELLAQDKVLNLAHAGGDQSWPHSTAFAFSEAVESGADVLEMDVRLTSDGELIVHHDDTVDRTTEVKGLVEEMTLAELQALDNAHWFREGCWACQENTSTDYLLRGVRTGEVDPPDGYTPDDFRIETFEAIATRFPGLALDVEIKGELPGAADTAQVLADELRQLDRTDSVVVVSFDDEIIDVFHEIAPEVEISPGTSRLTTWFIGGEPLPEPFRIIQIPPVSSGIPLVSPETIARADREGITVWVWPDDAATQENEAFYAETIALGIDGFIAGRPDEFTAALG